MSKLSRLAVAAILLVAFTACATTGPKQTKLMKSADLTVSAAALRVQVRALADRFSGLMEVTGENILDGETAPSERRRALQWLTNGIPAMQQALFQPDPLAALLDAWFLVAQIRYYFDSTAASDIPPYVAEAAKRALDEMEADIKNIIDNAGPDTNYEHGRQIVYEKAAEIPLDQHFVTPRASSVYLSEFTARAGGSALKSIGSVTETLDDLVARIDLDAEWIPKIARWQAMILADDYALDALGPTLQDVRAISEKVDSLLPTLESAPELIAHERRAVLEALDSLLDETLAFVDEQRATLMREDVKMERQEVLAALREERAAVLTALAEERRIVLEALHEERLETFSDLESLIGGAISRQIDRLFFRALLLIAVLLAGLAVIALLFARALERRRA